jgi:chromosome segregation ATPase
MEFMFIIMMIATVTVAILAAKMNSKIEALDEALEVLEDLQDHVLELETASITLEAQMEVCNADRKKSSSDEDLSKRIDALEKNVIANIQELSDLRAMMANLNQNIAEVAAFADRVSGKVDQIQNQINDDRPESF